MIKRVFNKKTKFALSLTLAVMFMLLMVPTVEASAAEGLSIYTTYPSISTRSGENIDTSITISNTTGTDMLVNLNIISLPQNWEAFIEGGGRVIDKVYVGKTPKTLF